VKKKKKKNNKKLNKKLILLQTVAISIFLSIFVFDFDNRLSANKRRACDKFFEGDIEFIELKQLWKPKEESQSKLYRKYFKEWVSWQNLGDTTNEITGENICNFNRYKKQKNRSLLYQLLVFGFVYWFLYVGYDYENY
tara:strand:+ start:49 stop:462 length:414 start_codon:yes stop_codon:yes gene_type:complete